MAPHDSHHHFVVENPDSVEEIMARIAAGDSAAVFTLYLHHGRRIYGRVRSHAQACGARITHEEIWSLVLDVCVDLGNVAAAWKPGGALPWYWADNRVRRIVAAHVGIHADSLDDQLVAVADSADVASGVDADLGETYVGLLEHHFLVGLFDEARREAQLSDDDVVTLLRFNEQQLQGDPSPANTLADALAVKPATVRKRVSRSRRRLRAVVEADARYRPLSEFGLAS